MAEKLIYFDNAATSYPKPPEVYDRMDRFLREEAANPGRSGHRMSIETEAAIQRARATLARLFGIREVTRIIFTLNGTDSLNIAIKGILRDGDHVVTTQLEHNSVLRPLNALERAGRIGLTHVPHSGEGFVDPGEIRKAFRPNTRLVVVSHGSNVMGTVQDIGAMGKIVREKEAFFLVDAAQTAGCYPLHVEKDSIDLLAFPGHKALFGPPGTGALYVGERVTLSAWREGGTGVDSHSPVQPEEMPFFLEGGTPNSVGIVGLCQGVSFVLREGIEKIREHELRLIRRLKQGLAAIPGLTLYPPPSSGAGKVLSTAACNLEGVDPQELGVILDQSYGIACRAGLHCAPLAHQSLGTYPKGAVRFSPGYFNTEEEVDAALAALSEIRKEFSLP
jgi:cysteine desulfurase family protein